LDAGTRLSPAQLARLLQRVLHHVHPWPGFADRPDAGLSSRPSYTSACDFHRVKEGEWYLAFAPLFGHQYSHVWIDCRDIRDAYMRGKGIDYFDNTRRAIFAQRSDVISSPMKWTAYSSRLWGGMR
jgi:hypothetical protein